MVQIQHSSRNLIEDIEITNEKLYSTLLLHSRSVCVRQPSVPLYDWSPGGPWWCRHFWSIFFESSYVRRSLGCFLPFFQVENGWSMAACAQRHIKPNRQIHSQTPPPFPPFRFIDEGLVTLCPSRAGPWLALCKLGHLCKFPFPLFSLARGPLARNWNSLLKLIPLSVIFHKLSIK
jgi:hypothetical protein